MKSGKNIAASIRQKLLNTSREEKIEFQLILTRFALERFLYRLAQSEYSTDFVLKGAMLFQIWQKSFHRPTRDLDLLSFGEPDIEYFSKVFTEICDVDSFDDGVVFDSSTINIEPIKEKDEYKGLRVTLYAKLDSARIPIQIDIGFGDSIVPTPVKIDFPTLLELPSPTLRAYSRETVIAEKFHAMVCKGIANSRMKDFYDLYLLATTHSFQAGTLREAISATFQRRATEIPQEVPLAFTEEYVTDRTKVVQWKAFLRKSKLADSQELPFAKVVGVISKQIIPLILMRKEVDNKASWDSSNEKWISS